MVGLLRNSLALVSLVLPAALAAPAEPTLPEGFTPMTHAEWVKLSSSTPARSELVPRTPGGVRSAAP